MGPLGLVTVPSARMDPPGTVRLQAAAAEPYAHAVASVQLAAPLNIAVRQSARMTSLRRDPERLYPGIDLRLRLLRENAVAPDITLGLQSAIGHRRMAAEYLSLSKRYGDFDFTGGIAWGRLGSAAHMSNPLKALGDHFGKKRAADGDMPNSPADWFTGEDIGFFAGLQYDTPWIEGLSLKAEWGADRYVAESAAFDHDAPHPWAVGVSYSPTSWVNIGAGLIGGDRVMASLSLQGGLDSWRGRPYRTDDTPALRPYRTGLALPREMVRAAATDHTVLRDLNMNRDMVWTRLEADRTAPLPRQWGHAARAIANHAGPDAAAIEITPMIYGLRGPSVRLMRRDLEQTLAHHNGSPQEIWRNAQINAPARDDYYRPAPWRFADMLKNIRYIWDTQTSLSEEDRGVLYRTGLVVETERMLTRHLMAGGGLRVNIADNLEKLNALRPVSLLPVREDIDVFTQNRAVVDRAYMGWFKSFNTDVHMMAAAGYLEEMYGGVGGEILYRPFGKTFAIGAEAWQVFKRNPYADMAQGFTGDSILTGHINAWYEVPGTGLTLQARAGRYLAGDVGGTLAIRHSFTHGGSVEAFATATDGADLDPFGGTTHIYSGLRLSLPLGNLRPLPRGSVVRVTAAQMGRQTGQALDRPLPLYDVTDKFSLRRIAADWQTIAE